MFRIPSLSIVLAAAIGCDAGQVAAPTPGMPVKLAITRSSERTVLPMSDILINTCYNEPVGEEVRLSGNLIVVEWTISTPTGKMVRRRQVRFSGVRGLGLTSGIEYRVISNTQEIAHVDVDNLGSATFTDTFMLIGRGAEGSDFIAKQGMRLLSTPDGLEIQFSKSRIRCR